MLQLFSRPVCVVAAFITVLALSPANAQTQAHVVSQLGSAPLLGHAYTLPQLRTKMQSFPHRVRVAADELGMSPSEFREFESAIQSRPNWVVLPRRVDGMAWHSGKRTYVLHKVILPADTHGWAVTIDEPDQSLEVFVPASCGNISILRKFRPHIAQLTSHKRPPWGVLPSHQNFAPPATTAPAVATAAPAAAAASTATPATQPPAGQPSPVASSTPVETAVGTTPQTSGPAPAPSHGHRFRFPWFLLPLFFIPLGGGGAAAHSLPHIIPVVTCPK